jgi:DNA repair protein RadC
MNVHGGHRQRLKQRFLSHGLDSFDDHNVLELLLFYALPRVDINPIAHELIDRFGSLSGVFDAPYDELVKVPGIGENAALLLKLIPQSSRRYQISKGKHNSILNTSRKAGDFLLPYFFGERDEVVYMVCLDAKCKVLSCKLMFRGGVNSANVNLRKIVENALASNASSVILAHNHTSGIAIPSEEDKATTKKVIDALRAVDVALADHIVTADNDYVSFADNGFIK